MKTFKFTFASHRAGDQITVESDNEQDARVLAMKALWGGEHYTVMDPNGKLAQFSDGTHVQPYVGAGLDLIRTTVK